MPLRVFWTIPGVRANYGEMECAGDNFDIDDRKASGKDSYIDDEFDQDKKGRNMISLTELLVVALKFLTF